MAQSLMVGDRHLKPSTQSQIISKLIAPVHLAWRTGRLQALGELALLLALAYSYAAGALLDFNPNQLQQTGTQTQLAADFWLLQNSLKQNSALPLWNFYQRTGLPVSGSPAAILWNPIALLPTLLWGGPTGLKVSVFLALLFAGWGQWVFAQSFGLRGLFRLWVSALFMLSGGLALLWRLGAYPLLLALACLPWCLAAIWWALERRDLSSLVLAALAVTFVLTAETTYSIFYVPLYLAILISMKLAWSKARRRLATRVVTLIGLSLGLSSIIWLPLVTAWPYLNLLPGPDPDQKFSQPIPYALANYVVAKPDWFNTDILGAAVGANWHYIGWLPILALAFVPAAIVRSRRHRPGLLALSLVIFVLLAWEANRFTPVHYLYTLFPILYNLRLPGFLLVVAVGPLIVLAASSLQSLYAGLRPRWAGRAIALTLLQPHGSRPLARLKLKHLVNSLIALGLGFTLWDVYQVNQPFAFVSGELSSQPDFILNWLKAYDPGLYYVSLGGGLTFYDWLPAAYRAGLPAFNLDAEVALAPPESVAPFTVQPKYLVTLPNVLIQEQVQLVHDFSTYQIWRKTDALPFAFAAATDVLNSGQTLTLADVTAFPAQFDGPNRINVETLTPQTQIHQRLVVLVSDFPDWQVVVDGQPADVIQVNHYLGVDLQPGFHTYTFKFRPLAVGLGIIFSFITFMVMLVLLGLDRLNISRAIPHAVQVQSPHP